MGRKKIRIFLADPIHPGGINILKQNNFEVTRCTGLTNEKLIRFINNSNSGSLSGLVIRSVRKIDKYFINRVLNTGLKVICTASSGFDNIDVKHTKNRRINVLNVPDGNFVPAAEHTFGLILAISKNIIGAHLKMKKRKFDSSFRNFELQGKRIGIIGVGRVGSYVARIAKSFNMRVLGNDIDNSVIRKYKWIRFLPLNDLIESCDIVSVHTPLDNSTVDLLNGKNLKLLRSNAVLINCARGGIVNEKALIDLLKRKKIYYAGLDVFKNEPEIDKRFCTLGNVVLSPHLAGKTIESAERISVQLAERIVMYFKKK